MSDKHLLKMEHGPALPEVVHCERVAECVQGACRRIEAHTDA